MHSIGGDSADTHNSFRLRQNHGIATPALGSAGRGEVERPKGRNYVFDRGKLTDPNESVVSLSEGDELWFP